MSSITTTDPWPTETEALSPEWTRRRGPHDAPASPDTPVVSPIWRSARSRLGASGVGRRPRRWRPWLAVGAFTAVVVALAALSTPPSDLTVTEAPVVGFDGSDRSFGTSTLIRHDDSVEGWVHTSGLRPREAVTLWWVIFNEPDHCTPPACDADDIFAGGDPAAGPDAERIAAADVVVGWAAGGVARDGSVSLAFALDEGEPVDDRQFGTGAGLSSPRGAEIHLVVRSHGPAGADVARQLATFDGGCTRSLVPPDRPELPGECGDVQFSVHRPEPRSTS